MRRRERSFFLLLGTVCAFALLAGAWPIPLIAFALLELSFTSVERVAVRRRRQVRRARLGAGSYPPHAARGILRSTP
jgi:Flp pilus assembly protein TadB